MASEKDGTGKNLDINSDYGKLQVYRTRNIKEKVISFSQFSEGFGIQTIWIPMTPENKAKLLEAWESLED